MYIWGTESRELSQKDATIKIKGKGNHSGRAVGKTSFFMPDLSVPPRLPGTEKSEEMLYFEARKNLLKRLRQFYGELRDKSNCAWIFLMQSALLCDDIFTELPHLYLCEGKSAVQTVLLCRDYFYSVLCKKDGGENLHAVSADIDDISVRLISELKREDTTPLPHQTILLCHTPPASYIAEWHECLAGVVSEDKATAAHHAELALSLEIPYLSTRDELSADLSEHNALIDSEGGYLYINPDLVTLSRFADDESGRKSEEERDILLTSKPIMKDNGKKMLVFAELGNPGELSRLSERYCDGIGKLTSEDLYLENMCLADEETLFEEYRRAAEIMPTKPIIIRGFKTLGAVRLESVISENATGDKGELYVLYDTTLRTQLRAVMRAAVYGSLMFLLPQSDRYSDLSQCASLMEELSAELYEEDREFSPVPLGSVIDTVPSALMCDRILEECDFAVADAEKLRHSLCEDESTEVYPDNDNMRLESLIHLVEHIAKTAAKKKKRAVLSLGKTCSPDIFPPSLPCEFFAVSASLEKLTKVKKAILEPAPIK